MLNPQIPQSIRRGVECASANPDLKATYPVLVAFGSYVRSVVKTRVLLVDDDKDTARAFQILLERRGYEVSVAHDVEASLQISRSTKIDVVVCDICFPALPGYHFLKSFREMTDTPVLAISSRARVEDREEATRRGFVDLIAKPVLVDNLVRFIEEAIALNPQ